MECENRVSHALYRLRQGASATVLTTACTTRVSGADRHVRHVAISNDVAFSKRSGRRAYGPGYFLPRSNSFRHNT